MLAPLPFAPRVLDNWDKISVALEPLLLLVVDDCEVATESLPPLDLVKEAKASKILFDSLELSVASGFTGSTLVLGGDPGGVVDLKYLLLMLLIISGEKVCSLAQMSTNFSILLLTEGLISNSMASSTIDSINSLVLKTAEANVPSGASGTNGSPFLSASSMNFLTIESTIYKVPNLFVDEFALH